MFIRPDAGDAQRECAEERKQRLERYRKDLELVELGAEIKDMHGIVIAGPEVVRGGQSIANGLFH